MMCKKKGLCTAVLSFVLCSSLGAAEYFVATDGDDASQGTIDKPFATLQRAVEDLKPGDTCFLRGGRYLQPVKLTWLKGQAGKPIVISAYKDEEVVFDGTIKIDAKWELWKNGIYQAKLGHDTWQLFSQSQVMDLARWPNASIRDGSVWNVNTAMRSTDRYLNHSKKKTTSVSQPGLILDMNHHGVTEGGNSQTLAETGINFTGALAVLNIGHWLTWTRPIVSHKAGENQFTYDESNTKMMKFLEYYIYGLQALDRENEWWFEKQNKMLYFKPVAGEQPSELDLRGKVHDFNLLMTDCSHVRITGINFFATTFGLKDCDHVVIDQCDLLYPSTHKFVLGELNWVGVDRSKSRSSVAKGNTMTYISNKGDGPFHNRVQNCKIEYANSPAIGMYSPGSTLENCYLSNIEWDVNSSGGSGSLPGGNNTLILNNTLHTTGGSEGIRVGAGSTIAGNRIYNTSLLQHDGAAINVGTASQPGTIVYRNWVYQTNRQGIRLDSTGSSFGTNASVTENVIFDVEGGVGGSKFKGDYQLFAKNTAFDGFVAIPKGFGDTAVHNRHSLVRNNLVDDLVEWNMRQRRDGIPAEMDHNVSGKGVVRQLLRDPDNFDFRPRKSSSNIIDSGHPVKREDLKGDRIRIPEQIFDGAMPDIGAYEYESPIYWIPGCTLIKASSPVPPNKSISVKKDADLMWLKGREAVSHHVYLVDQKSRDELLKAVPENVIAKSDRASTNVFDPGTLVDGLSYCWRVDVVCKDGSVLQGDIWEFTVQQAAKKLD